MSRTRRVGGKRPNRQLNVAATARSASTLAMSRDATPARCSSRGRTRSASCTTIHEHNLHRNDARPRPLADYSVAHEIARAAGYRLMLELSAESHNHHGAGHALDNLPLSHAAIARDRRKYPQSANAELQLYEFGCKVSITTPVTSPKGGQFLLHAKALHDNPYDGHTLGPVAAHRRRGSPYPCRQRLSRPTAIHTDFAFKSPVGYATSSNRSVVRCAAAQPVMAISS
jgi:hypothetical protein